MFRIIFALLMIGSVVFTIYNPALSGIFLILVELMYLLVAALLFLRLKRGVKTHFREEAQGCAVRVENALNGLDGIWATVRLESRRAVIRGKHPIEESLIRETVLRAGYGVEDYLSKRGEP